MTDHHRPAVPAAATLREDVHAREHHARIARQIEDERVAIIYALATMPLLAGMAFCLLLSVVIWPYRSGALVLGWLAFKLLVGVVRMQDATRFPRAMAAGDDTDVWRRRFFRLLVLDSLAWAAMGVLFMPMEAPGIRAVMLAALVGVAGVGVFSLVADSRHSILFLCATLLPSVVHEAWRGNADGWFASFGLAIYMAIMCFEARRSEARVTEMLRLRFENAWIAEERQRAMLLSEHASAAKSRFLATVSHEMRTPLNGIMGMTQLLQRSPLNEEQRAQLEIVHDSSRHLQNVIADLLDLSRIEFGKLAIQDEPLQLRDTVREVTGLLQAVAEDKGLRFDLAFAPELPDCIVGDASRIKQVLHNLLGNAIKFTAQGHVGLHLRPSGDQLHFEVEDSGEGVAAHMTERIFDAFEQGPAATVQGRAGTGLGLTISRRLARAMGGDVVCEPPRGRGARFVFSMPCRTLASAAPPPAPREPSAEHVPQLQGRVLVVDDNAVNALVASAMLTRLGLEVDVADDGPPALERLTRGDIDLVLMDCQLPTLDGWETTRRWRMGERAGQRLPIVALTANAVLGDRERCLDAGMDDYLAKPVEMDALAAVAARYLAPREALRRAG